MDYGLLGLIILALDIYAIYNILQESWSGLKKVVWIDRTRTGRAIQRQLKSSPGWPVAGGSFHANT